jgi:cell division protein FtsB
MSPASRIALALLVLALMVYVPYHVLKNDPTTDYERLQRSVAQMRASNEALKRENQRLEERHKHLKDPRLLERHARERLDMIRPNEVLLVFPEPDPLKRASSDRKVPDELPPLPPSPTPPTPQR